MARSNAAKEGTPQDEMEDILSKVLNTEFEGGRDEEEEDPSVEDEGPLSSDREEAVGDESATEDEPEASEADSEPTAHDEGGEDEDEDDESEPLAADADEKQPQDEARKSYEDQIEGLKRELVKQRQKNRGMQQAPAPPPLTTTAPQHQAPQAQDTQGETGPPRVGVLVSEDGQSVYVDPVTQAARDEYIIAQAVTRARQMSPEDQKIRAAASAVDRFIGENEGHRDVVDRAKAVDDFITLHVENMMENGRRFSSIDDVIHTLQVEGIDRQVAEYFPETDGIFAEFTAGISSDNPLHRVGAMKLLSRSMPQGSSKSAPVGELGKLKSVKGGPKSMARKGGTRSQSPSADKAEFESLQGNLRKDFLTFSDANMARMKELGRKLDMPGFESEE